MDELKKLDIALTILLGCAHHRAALLIHIGRCDRCRLAFQQVIDRMLDDAPRELRQVLAGAIRKRMESEEVLEAQKELLEAEEQLLADPANRPN